ncbi:MAG: hypothetical protein IPH16_01980 [Haliscomenobacter sp.]|nr:hypothetical protein [Haliscomenobacter sp.]
MNHQFQILQLETETIKQDEISTFKKKKKKIKQRKVTTKLFKKLSKLNVAMLDMTVLFRNITGKDEETVQEEELKRLNRVAYLGNDFLNYYNQNKIYFDKESCDLIEKIFRIFMGSHSTFTFLKQMSLGPSNLTFEQTNKAIKMVREEALPLLKQLENKLRDIIKE